MSLPTSNMLNNPFTKFKLIGEIHFKDGKWNNNFTCVKENVFFLCLSCGAQVFSSFFYFFGHPAFLSCLCVFEEVTKNVRNGTVLHSFTCKMRQGMRVSFCFKILVKFDDVFPILFEFCSIYGRAINSWSVWKTGM